VLLLPFAFDIVAVAAVKVGGRSRLGPVVSAVPPQQGEHGQQIDGERDRWCNSRGEHLTTGKKKWDTKEKCRAE
jgi:hypothetical protein